MQEACRPTGWAWLAQVTDAQYDIVAVAVLLAHAAVQCERWSWLHDVLHAHAALQCL